MKEKSHLPETRISGLLRLFRFELPFTAGLCAILGELLALGKLPTISEIVLGFLSVFAISAAALILNDYFDLESDIINALERPLPSGLVSKQDVLILSIAVTIAGFITAYLISLTALLVSILVWLVGFLYNWRFKKVLIIGNLMVSISVGMTFIFGGIAVNQPFSEVVWFFAIWVMLINFWEEIATDAMDTQGDQKVGVRSIALVLGQESALNISASLFLVAVVTSILPLILGWLALVCLIPFLFTDAIILLATTKLLDPLNKKGRNYIRWFYLSGMVTLLAVIILQFVL